MTAFELIRAYPLLACRIGVHPKIESSIFTQL